MQRQAPERSVGGREDRQVQRLILRRYGCAATGGRCGRGRRNRGFLDECGHRRTACVAQHQPGALHPECRGLFERLQIGGLLRHDRLLAHHPRGAGRTDVDRVAVDRVGGGVGVASAVSGQRAILAEDRGHLDTGQRGLKASPAVVVAGHQPGCAGQHRGLYGLEDQERLALRVRDRQLLAVELVACSSLQVLQESALLSHDGRLACHHGRDGPAGRELAITRIEGRGVGIAARGPGDPASRKFRGGLAVGQR